MQTIILLHGAIGANDQMEPLKTELLALGYRVYSFNFSGHGQASFEKDFGIKQFAGELLEFVVKNHLIRPTIFGYSMGGYVALYLASQKQGLIGNIITLGTKFGWNPEIAQREIKMLDVTTIKEKVPKFAAALQIRHGKNWEVLLERTSEMMIDLGKNNLLDEKTFSEIKNKVLIGLAENDPMISIEETNHARDCIKNASTFILEFSKHPIESVDIRKLTGYIVAFDTRAANDFI